MTDTDFAKAARLMAGTKPPPAWLPNALYYYGEVLKTSRRNEAKRPSRREMKKRLTEVQKAAGTLLSALGDPPTVTMLHSHAVDPESIWDIWSGLSDIATTAEKAELALASMHGPDRARTTAEVPPRVICTLIVQIVMEHLTNKRPTGRGKRDQAAAEALWRASGGPDFGGHTDKTNPLSWESVFKNTNKVTPAFAFALKAMLLDRTRVAIPP